MHSGDVSLLVYDRTSCGRVLRYFERVSVATFFSIAAEIDSIFLFVASCQRLFVAGCQLTLFLDNKPVCGGNRLTVNLIFTTRGL